MLQLLESAIESTRKSLGVLGFEPCTGSICDTVSAVALVFQDAHPVLQLSLDLPAIPPISFDRRLIQQALGNLLTNTMKYSVGAPRAKISVVAENDAVQIIVRDHGIGIPAPDREGIFDDYVRAGNVGERPGTGLGLSIVQQIASLHGGNVDIVETDGQGTSIRITLPCG